MFKIKVCITIITLGLLSACTSHHLQKASNNDIPLDRLINQLPTRDSIESTLIFDAILDYGQKGVTDICLYMESSDNEKKVQAQWALHGLAIHVTRGNREKQRLIYLSGLNTFLGLSLSVENQTFVIDQIKIIGLDESVPILEAYIQQPNLCEPAIQALTAIGTESAGNVLYKALPIVEGKVKISVVLALGSMQYEPAGPDILNLLNNSNDQLKEVSASAVSSIGYEPARGPLKELVDKDKHFIRYYLRLAERLGEKGKLTSSLTICDEIIKGDYSENSIINALSILVKYNPQEAESQLYKLISQDNKKIRLSALDLVGSFDESKFVPILIDICQESESDIKSDIIYMFGKQKCQSALPYIRESLNSPVPEVRITSLNSLWELTGTKSLSEIATVLGDSLDENATSQIQNILMTIADTSSFDYLMSSFHNFSSNSKVLILTVLSERHNSSYKEYFIESLKSSESMLRESSLRGLESIGDESSLKPLIEFLLNSENDLEKSQAITAIKSITNRSKFKKENSTLIINYYENATVDEKLILFDLFKAVGGTELLELTKREIENKDIKINQEAFRTLTEWPDEEALAILIETGHKDNDERNRILALRGSLRILNETQMGDQRKLSYYKEIMDSVIRPEEKRQVLAGLSDIKTVSSLKLITSYLEDLAVKHEAFLAALSVSSPNEDGNQQISREEIVIALVESKSDKELRDKIVAYYQKEITKPQPPEGFIALFNGVNLDGWKGLVQNPVKRNEMTDEELSKAQIEADESMRAHWQVTDGILYFDGGGSHLCTNEDYRDFELYVDWKIEKEGDSGIYLRGAPQVQIWDPGKWPEGSGGLYNNQNHPAQPLERADNPVGEWNTFYMIMLGDRVTVYLNEILVVDNVQMENYWESDKPIYPTGQIELQSHNTPLYFRNIFIRELEPKKPVFDGYLFNGKDLKGWQVIGNEPDSWQVEDSILYTESKGGGWLSTTELYSDFKLELEFKVPVGGNSGVFLRAPHLGDPAYSGIEVQILDDDAEIYSQLNAWQYTGSLYGLKSPTKRISKRAGEWQEMEILCVGPVIKVFLNDEQIIDSNLIEFMSEEDEHPGIKRREGYIGLQNHDSKIEFRNIRIREIDK